MMFLTAFSEVDPTAVLFYGTVYALGISGIVALLSALRHNRDTDACVLLVLLTLLSALLLKVGGYW